MRTWVVVFMLLSLTGFSLGQERSSEPLDALGYELMTLAGVEPAECPHEVLVESQYSILFCGKKAPPGKSFADDARAAADVTLQDVGQVPFWGADSEWEKKESWFRREYHVGDSRVTVGVHRKLGFLFLRYPWRFPHCLAAIPTPENTGERIAPRIIRESLSKRPEYPEIARIARLEAAVFLEARISKEGDVVDVCLQHVSRPDMGFEDAAKSEVEKWKYEPATIGGEPVDMRFSITVEFKLH